jgi:hypothetical protein
LTLAAAKVRRRQRDDQQAVKLRGKVQQAAKKEEIVALIQDFYNILYGPGITPTDRQQFLERYGCTGWTEEVLITLLDVAAERGIIEMGAGNGQWARVLNDRHQQSGGEMWDFVLAYDDMSNLPLNPAVYRTDKTDALTKHFFGKVQECKNRKEVFSKCPGRVLLLVYPPPGGMAKECLQAYLEADPINNDIIAYVGEGRFGANADESFFDALESDEWMLWRLLPVKPFGTKGYEKLYIFKKTRSRS